MPELNPVRPNNASLRVTLPDEHTAVAGFPQLFTAKGAADFDHLVNG